jgi:hypothetical protein
MRAKRVDRNQPEIVKALRAYGCSVQHTHMMGEGFPDLIVGHRHSHRIGFMEIKDGEKVPSARKLKKTQEKFFAEWGGFPIGLVTDVDGALRFARMLAFGDDK